MTIIFQDSFTDADGTLLPQTPAVSIGSSGGSSASKSATYDFNRRINNDGTW